MVSEVGFIGLGAMGVPIATNLVAAGFKLRVWNRTRAAADAFAAQIEAKLGAEARARVTVVDTCAAAVPSPQGIVVTMVSNDPALKEVCAAVGPALGAGGLHLVMSTVSPDVTASLAAAAAAAGTQYVASPVFGRPEAAAARRLICVVGGTTEAVERCRPLLEATSQKVVQVGPQPQQALVLKLAGNFLLLSVIESLGEAFTLAESAGVERETAKSLYCDTVFSLLPIYPSYGRMIASHTYTPPGFTALNGLKDAGLVCAAAAAGGVRMPVAELVRSRLEAVVAEPGGGERDWASFAAQITVDKTQGAGGGGGGTRGASGAQ